MLSLFPSLFKVFLFGLNQFKVERIPSVDTVHLIATPSFIATYYPNAKFFINCSGLTNHLTSCLHVGCLCETTTKEDLFLLFKQYGKVNRVSIKKKDTKDRTRRYAFIYFASVGDAMFA